MKKTLSELELIDFDQYPVWCFADDENVNGELDFDYVRPVRAESIIENNETMMMVRINGEMIDGTIINGIASVESSPPCLLPGLSFYFNREWLTLNLPPAPKFVLDKEGPYVFASKIGKKVEEIFPLTIETDVIFTFNNNKLRSIITENGQKRR